MQLSGRSWDLVVPTFFAIKSSRHQGSKVRATNLHGTWNPDQRTSSMFLLMPVTLTEQQFGTALLLLGHHCRIDFPAHWSDGQPRESWDFSCSGLISFQQGCLHGCAVPDRFLVFALWCPASRQFGMLFETILHVSLLPFGAQKIMF